MGLGQVFGQKNIQVLGFAPTKDRMIQLGTGFFISGLCCIIYHLLKTSFSDNYWILNPKTSIVALLKNSWWTFISVLSEELIFRGAILYLLIQARGPKTACFLSAISFGIYHLFSYNALGNPFQAVIIFIMTGTFGLLLAYSFAKTRSLYLPVFLHFGWNWFNIIIFSSGPLGPQLLIKANTNQLEGWSSLAILIFQITAVPLLTYGYLNYISGKQKTSDI